MSDDDSFEIPQNNAQWKCKLTVRLGDDVNNLECELAKDWMNFDPKLIRTVSNPVLQFPLTTEHRVDIELSSLSMPDSKKIWKDLKPNEFMDKTNCGKTSGEGVFMHTSTPWEGWLERKKAIFGGLCLDTVDYPNDVLVEKQEGAKGENKKTEDAPPELIDD